MCTSNDHQVMMISYAKLFQNHTRLKQVTNHGQTPLALFVKVKV